MESADSSGPPAPAPVLKQSLSGFGVAGLLSSEEESVAVVVAAVTAGDFLSLSFSSTHLEATSGRA